MPREEYYLWIFYLKAWHGCYCCVLKQLRDWDCHLCTQEHEFIEAANDDIFWSVGFRPPKARSWIHYHNFWWSCNITVKVIPSKIYFFDSLFGNLERHFFKNNQLKMEYLFLMFWHLILSGDESDEFSVKIWKGSTTLKSMMVNSKFSQQRFWHWLAWEWDSRYDSNETP